MIPINVSQRPAGDCAACSDALDFQFDYAFQPIVDVRRRSIYAHEALVRGPNGEAAASVLARLTPANSYVFDQTSRIKAVECAARLHMRELLSINFNANAVRDPRHCIRSTFAAARANNFPVEQILFEVTEGERVADSGHLVEIFNAYREYGFKTAIDDFGAGYAGLNLLSDYQPDVLKIDMALVRDVDRKVPRQAIVRAVAAMCGELGIAVLGEGVETSAERDFLFDAGIELMQGYYFCKPVFQGLGTIDASLWP